MHIYTVDFLSQLHVSFFLSLHVSLSISSPAFPPLRLGRQQQPKKGKKKEKEKRNLKCSPVELKQ